MSEVKTEPAEASEILSPDTDKQIDEQLEFDFLPQEEAPAEDEAPKKEEVIQVGKTKVVFREPTEEELPTRAVTRADGGIIGQDFFSQDGEWTATVVGQSPNGNKLQVTKRPDGVGYILGWRNGGMVPSKYAGWYTTFEKAEHSARIHLSELWEEAREASRVA